MIYSSLLKKIDQSEYSKVLALLPVETEFVANTYVKQVVQAYEKEQEFFLTQQSPQSGSSNPKRATTGKKVKIRKTNKKECKPKKMGSFLLLREKPWSNFIQKALLLLVAQSDFIHKAKYQWLK